MSGKWINLALCAALIGGLASGCSPQSSETSDAVDNVGAELPASGWSLIGDQSHISFASVKKGDIGEPGHFNGLSGTVAENGDIEITIDLASVDTEIPQRDERMREFLFETSQFAEAKASANIAYDQWKDIKMGERRSVSQPLELSLHGETAELLAQLVVTRIAANRILVETSEPLIVNADDFGLAGGIDKLKELAGLDAISLAVPVSASLVFEHQ